jgi:Tfp pilus assembly protein PilX
VLGNERGVALVLSLIVLLTVSGLALAFLSVSAFEPRIARNLSDAARARYLAEAGLEIGYATLVAAGGPEGTWSSLLAAATPASPWVALPSLTRAAPPGLTPGEGTYSVTIRNDSQPSDVVTTGEPAADWSVTRDDRNRVVIMRSTGTFDAATRTIEVVVKRQSPTKADRPAPPTMSNWREI